MIQAQLEQSNTRDTDEKTVTVIKQHTTVEPIRASIDTHAYGISNCIEPTPNLNSEEPSVADIIIVTGYRRGSLSYNRFE